MDPIERWGIFQPIMLVLRGGGDFYRNYLSPGHQPSYSQMSNEKNSGCLACIGDYTTNYRDYNKPL